MLAQTVINGDYGWFDKPFNIGDSITFTTPSVDLTPHAAGLDNTVLNICSAAKNRLLHMSFRRKNKSVVLTSRKGYTGGGWLSGQTVSMNDWFEAGKPTTIVVKEEQDTFEIYISRELFHSYKKQIRLPVAGVAYLMEKGQTEAMFGSGIDVAASTAHDSANGKDYRDAYFSVKPKDVEEESKLDPFDIIIIGSGIGGGVLATSFMEKNARVQSSAFHDESTPEDDPMQPHWRVERPASGGTPADDISEPPKPKRILVLEKGGLIFHTHSMNGPRPSNSGTTSQGNDLFYQKFKETIDMDEESSKIWMGGPVFCLGGRAAVWGLFAPRVSIGTLKEQFPPEVKDALLDNYYFKAERLMDVAYPTTLAPHQALIDRLNLHTNPDLPTTQWQWGRISSEFSAKKNYSYAGGAYSPIDQLMEAAMNDPKGDKHSDFRTVLESPVVRLEPAPKPGQLQKVTHVVINDNGVERKIACNHAVVSAGTIETGAILLRSAGGDAKQFGNDFAQRFGHVTDHRILAVSMPFFYKDMADRDFIGGMKLQTDIQFRIKKGGEIVDDTTALANIALDTVSFLPRADASNGLLPMLVIAYILPCDLAPDNKIELNSAQEPKVHIGWAPDKYLDDKKGVMAEFAMDIMNKMVQVLDVRFAKQTNQGYEPILRDIVLNDIKISEAGPGVVAHELGSTPMPNNKGYGGVIDTDLRMKYGWNNVSVCDLSIFPYSAAANPTLTLAALSLRLSDKLYPMPEYSPFTVYNLTGNSVVVSFSNSRPSQPSFGPVFPLEIASGASAQWKIAQRETMTVQACECADTYDVQMVYPGINAMVVNPPPRPLTCSCLQN